MKKISALMVIAAIGMIVASCGKSYKADVKLKSGVDSFFYAVGVSYGSGLRENLKTVPGADGKEHYDAIITGFAIAMNDQASQLKMTPEEAQMFIQEYLTTAQMKEAEEAKAKEAAFFADNSSKPGVITTESGVQYKVLTEGTGEKPTEEDRVIVHYTGRLLDGTVFDSSIERGEPATFGVMQVIRGWSQMLLMMQVGSKYQVWIPADLAYGPQQMSEVLKPYSTLEFEMELLGIEGK